MSTQAQETREALGARLRGFRKDAGFTSGRALARALGWQESKVSRIENGKQSVSEADIRAWCDATNQQQHTADLIATVRHIDEMWMDWRRVLKNGAEGRQKSGLQVYRRTKLCRIWHPTVVWGTFQTPEYAEATLRQVVDLYGIPDDAEAATAKRLERQQYLYRGDRRFNVVLGEQALYSNFGGPEVMKGQLDRLLTMMRLARVNLGIIPRSAPLRVWPGNSFSMFDDKLVLVETYSAELTVTQPGEIDTYIKAFTLLNQSAVFGGAVRDLIWAAFQHFDRMPTD
ncbi:helix-turn-helix domain-containing protein [Streptomyces sp. HU2014]|uniref:helix-turn-helix domain-containing protein n=1 Tax=Streptomyces sp. HU2014 TaxID=2939414 RepID=UPI00200EB942|nr:helix-turn-helix transcriptional regulator [Streptomyces sp. HU2014]UQI44606.1 helix-turn-helix domain-containing protein [Streptomyces sp. HU2014]